MSTKTKERLERIKSDYGSTIERMVRLRLKKKRVSTERLISALAEVLEERHRVTYVPPTKEACRFQPQPFNARSLVGKGVFRPLRKHRKR